MSHPVAIAFDELPFHIGVADAPTNEPFPDVLSFVAAIDEDLGLLVQAPDPRVITELDRVYRRGSMLGTPLSAEGLGRDYAEDFLGFIAAVLPGGASGASILEIGCGSGYLLARLRSLGAEVTGIEPGEQGRQGAAEYGISIVHEAFTGPERFEGRTFDVILHHCVLEHVPDPIAFLRGQARLLAPGGRIIIGVPNEEPYIAAGDISTLAHEHWSFFTRSSLSRTLAAAGLATRVMREAGFGGALYAVAQSGEPGAGPVSGSVGIAAGFGDAARDLLARLAAFFTETSRTGRSVGLWPAARAYNYLHVLHPPVRPRMFDDDRRLTGRYYPPIAIPVEDRAAIAAHPVDELVILSRAFGGTLRAELGALPSLARTRIRLIDEIGR